RLQRVLRHPLASGTHVEVVTRGDDAGVVDGLLQVDEGVLVELPPELPGVQVGLELHALTGRRTAAARGTRGAARARTGRAGGRGTGRAGRRRAAGSGGRRTARTGSAAAAAAGVRRHDVARTT